MTTTYHPVHRPRLSAYVMWFNSVRDWYTYANDSTNNNGRRRVLARSSEGREVRQGEVSTVNENCMYIDIYILIYLYLYINDRINLNVRNTLE